MLGGAGLGPRGSGTGAADGEGTLVPEGRRQGGDVGELHALPPMEAGGPPERGRPAIPPAKGLVEPGAWQRRWVTRCRVDSPHLGSAPVSVQWRKHPMRMSSRLRRRGTGPSRAWRAQATAARGGGVARGSHGRARGEGRRWVAPCRPAARPLHPSPQAAAGNRLRPAPAHPVQGRRREGAVRGVRYIVPRHFARYLCYAEREGRRCTHL